MASDLEIPQFAVVLAPVIGDLPQEFVPALLSGLEVAAASRYRAWAEASTDADQKAGLLACADREEEIAARVARLFPLGAEARTRVDETLPAAREAFMAVFSPHDTRDQQRIQAHAERQGAAAWRGLAEATSDPAIQKELLVCAELEERSADYLDSILT